MAFTKKGERRTHAAGRQKGTPNKITRELRESILTAARRAGGGRNGLVAFLEARANDEDPKVRSAFLGILGRCLPREVKLEGGGPLLEIRDYTGRSGQVESSEPLPEALPEALQ